MHAAIPADLCAAPRCFEKMCQALCSVKYMIILITPVAHEYIFAQRKTRKQGSKVFTVFIKQLVLKHLHNKHPSEHEAGLETNPRAQTKLTSPQKRFTSRRTKALEKLSYKHDGVSSHSHMNIFQLICDDHVVLFSDKNKDERTHCPRVELQSSMEAVYIHLKSSVIQETKQQYQQ